MAAVLGLATAFSLAIVTPSHASGDKYGPINNVERERGVRTATTDGHSFLEVNEAGELVLWRRTGETFYREVRGSGWQPARLITTLSTDSFIEVKSDGRLAKWTWNGGTYTQQIVGTGWQPARLLTGIGPNKFLEINDAGELVLWTFDAGNNLSRTVRGSGWQGTRHLTGLADNPMFFFEIKPNNTLSVWYDDNGLHEVNSPDSNFQTVRLTAGLDFDHYLVVDQNTGLYEYAYDEGTNSWAWHERGSGWNTARLIG